MALRDRAAAGREPGAQLRVAHEPAQRGDDLGPAVRVHEQRVLTVHRHVAGGARAPAAQERQARRGALAHRDAEGLVGADERQHVGLRVGRGQLGGRHGAGHPRGHAEPGDPLPQLSLERPASVQHELGLAGQAGLGEGVQQQGQVLVRHEPPDDEHAHRAGAALGRARPPRSGSRSAL